MPKDATHFEQMEGIWVSSLSCILPVASALRVSIIELAGVRRSSEGQETKAQQMYAYLTGPRFKHRIECIAEKFTELRSDLDKERKWMNKQWRSGIANSWTYSKPLQACTAICKASRGESLEDIDALEGHMRLELS